MGKVGALGPVGGPLFGTHLGSLLFGAHLGPFLFYLGYIWAHFGPWDPFGGARWPILTYLALEN